MRSGQATMPAGSCLCGGVRYRVDGALGALVLCHCSRCRKANGSAFQAVSPIATGDFVLLSGAELLSEYTSSPGVHRVSCRVCHAPLYSRRDAMPGTLRLRVGTLDTPVDADIGMHIFTSDRADWYRIRDDAPQYPTRPGE